VSALHGLCRTGFLCYVNGGARSAFSELALGTSTHGLVELAILDAGDATRARSSVDASKASFARKGKAASLLS
jgi:hypothetical protein